MPRGKKRPHDDVDDAADGGAEAEAEPSAAAADKMDVDEPSSSSIEEEGEEEETEVREEEMSVAERLRRRRARPSKLLACEGDLLAVPTASFVPPLDEHSRSFVIVEPLADVAKGCGSYQVAIFYESSADGEWTTVADSRRKAAVDETWPSCAVKARWVGTKKIRLTYPEQMRVYQS